MTVVMVIYLSQTTPIGFDRYVDHRRQWSYISSDDTSKRYKCDVTVVKVIYLSQTTQVRQDLTAVLITRDSASTNSMEGNNDEMWFLDDDYVVEDEEQLVDEGEHDVPFNVADIPQQLVTADAHAQRDVHLGLYEQQPASGRDHVTKFKASGVKGMQMSTLQSMHDNKRVMAAVGLLRQRHRITMDNHHWNAKLQLNLSTQLWPDMQMRVLPFNPQGWMMVLGTCMDEQLWLAMAPNMYFKEGYGENREEVVPVLESKTMALCTEHRYMMIMFIAHVLDLMRHEDIHCIMEYPEPLTLESIKASTEVLDFLIGFWLGQVRYAQNEGIRYNTTSNGHI
ncbi:hypothetical protein EDC04DRAFT_2614981 [Pisolithus marmoratus]|nr:hypothetical protein EDC04DRAFT_2614981 [Pisolithus marmoratus]